MANATLSTKQQLCCSVPYRGVIVEPHFVLHVFLRCVPPCVAKTLHGWGVVGSRSKNDFELAMKQILVQGHAPRLLHEARKPVISSTRTQKTRIVSTSRSNPGGLLLTSQMIDMCWRDIMTCQYRGNRVQTVSHSVASSPGLFITDADTERSTWMSGE